MLVSDSTKREVGQFLGCEVVKLIQAMKVKDLSSE